MVSYERPCRSSECVTHVGAEGAPTRAVRATYRSGCGTRHPGAALSRLFAAAAQRSEIGSPYCPQRHSPLSRRNSKSLAIGIACMNRSGCIVLASHCVLLGKTLLCRTSKGSAVHPAFPRMLPQCMRPSLARANSVLERMANPEHSTSRCGSRLQSSLVEEWHRLDNLAMQIRLRIGKWPPADV
jgi:hypothetical protein